MTLREKQVPNYLWQENLAHSKIGYLVQQRPETKFKYLELLICSGI